MSAPGTSIFDNISRTPKSPKSNKRMSGLENPLLKSGQFSFGGGGGVSSSLTQSSSKTMPRSPLMSMSNSNYDPQNQRLQQPQQQSILKNGRKPSQSATPRPPPKMSLSLRGGMTLPMEVSNNITMQFSSEKEYVIAKCTVQLNVCYCLYAFVKINFVIISYISFFILTHAK